MAAKNSKSKVLFIRNPDVVLREENPDRALLFNPDTDRIRAINSTGLFIWKLCDGKHDLPAISKTMKNYFEEVPGIEAESQIKEFIDDMQANGFIGSIVENK
jgi:hypothetical protein